MTVTEKREQTTKKERTDAAKDKQSGSHSWQPAAPRTEGKGSSSVSQVIQPREMNALCKDTKLYLTNTIK